MLPLCDALHITVNDLLSGERVSETDYQKKAEDHMMDLMKENEENKKRMILSVICGGVTVVAVCALAMIVSVVELPRIVRIALIVLAVLTATAGIGTNLYLAKLAMDITAKHAAPDKDGVRIAELDEDDDLWEPSNCITEIVMMT